MSINLTDWIERGVIDNRTPGRVTGSLWLVGEDWPIDLLLEGDCWRDLAGMRIEFQNLEARVGRTRPEMERRQKGIVGDITASQKISVVRLVESDVFSFEDAFDQSAEEWRYQFNLEWFGETGERYYVCSSDIQIQVGEPAWSMDEDQESAQKMANQQAMRDYIQQQIGREEEGVPLGDSEEDEEIRWELQLQRTDRLNLAYREVMEKYADDEDSETKEAFVMGWDHLLGALAEESEQRPQEVYGSGQFEADFDDDEWQSDDEEEDDEDLIWREEDSRREHPLAKRAQYLVAKYWTQINEIESDVEDEDIDAFLQPFLTLSGKLASALNPMPDQVEKGFVLAMLKRCLNWCQEAVTALAPLENALGATRMQALRAELLDLRSEIQQLRADIKANGYH